VGNKELGVTLTDNGSTAKLSSVVVSGTQVGTSGVANGIGVQQGTSLTMVSSVVAGSAGVGLAVSGAQASVTTSVIRDTASASNGTSGDGISAITGSTVNVDSSWLFRNREVAVSISGVGTTATISKSTVYDSQPNGMGQFGVGISLESGAKLAMTGSVVAKSLYYGIELSDANTSAQIDDCLFRDTALDQKDGVGRNIDVQDGAKAVLQGTTVANASGESVVVDSTMAHADVNATQMLILGGHIGAFVRLGGTLEMAQSALVGNIGQGLYLTADVGASGVHSTATMTDSVIRDTQTGQSSSGGDTSGEGVLSGGIVSLTNVTVNDVYGSGVLIANNPQPVTMGSTGTITGGVVRGVKPEPMGVTLGHGIIGLDGSLVTVTGCTVTGSPGAGVAFESATALVSGAFITNNAVGIDVEGTSMVSQVDVAPAMLTTGQVVVTSSTVFTGNQSTISSMNLPLPPVPLMP